MKNIFQNILLYFIAISIAKLFGIIRSFLLVKIMSPSEYGIWITLKLIVTFGPILSLGVIETLDKKVPFYIGKKDNIKRSEIEGGVLGFLYLVTCIIILATISISIIKPSKISEYHLEIQIMLISLALSLFSIYFFYRLKAYQNFKIISIIEFLRTIILLIFQIPFAYYYGSFGAVIGFLFCELSICLISSKASIRYNKKVSIIFNKSVFLNIIKIGFPITIIWWVYILQSTTDRVVCMWLLGTQSTGYYGLGVSFVSILLLVSTSASSILYPKMNINFGKYENKLLILPFVTNPAMIISLFLPIIIFFIYYLLPLLYRFILNKYYPGLHSAQILIIGAFFSSNIRNAANYLISINEQNRFIKFVFLSTILNIVGNISLVFLGYGINGIAISTVLSNIVLFSLIWIHILKYTNNKSYFKSLFELFFPILLLITIIILLSCIFPESINPSINLNLIKLVISLTSYTIILVAIPSFRIKFEFMIREIKKK